MLPKLHPIMKTYTELKRCEIRIDEFISRFPEDATNEVDRYLKLQEMIQQAMELIPEDYRGRA